MVLHAAPRERGCERIKTSLECAGDIERIGAVLSGGLHEDAGAPPDHGLTEARLCAVAHAGDVTDAHAHASASADHRLGERIRSGAGGLRLQHHALRGSFDVAAADELGATPCRLSDILERQACRDQLDRIDQDLPLARFATEDLRLRHTRHAEDLWLDHPAHQIPQLNRRESIAREAKVHEVLHRRGQRREQRRACARGEQARRLGEALGYHLSLSVRIAAAVEDHLNGREPLA